MLYNEMFFYLSTFLYGVGTYFFVLSLFRRNSDGVVFVKQWFFIAVVASLFFQVIRFRAAGRLPMVTLFEIIFFYAWVISVFYLLFIRIDSGWLIHGLTIGIIVILLLWDVFLDRTIGPVNPLLDSYWLVVHVPTAMMSYGAFALSFVLSIYVMIAQKRGWTVQAIAQLNSGLIMIGTILLAVCIGTGAIWAKSAWGHYWSWDPKETWALITFIIYGAALCCRKIFKFSPCWQARVSVIGFCVLIFTFLGVSLLFSGSHSYLQ